MFCFFDQEAYGILAPWAGIELMPPPLEGNNLTTRPPEMSPGRFFITEPSLASQGLS